MTNPICEEQLTRQEIRLLRSLRTPKNSDGFYEMIMAELSTRENIKMLLENFNDHQNILKQITEIYEQSKFTSSFCKRMTFLAQISVMQKLTSKRGGTYNFIKNVAYIVDMKQLELLMQQSPTKKIKTMYFFKKIESISENITCQSKCKLLTEYRKYASRVSPYIVNLLSTDSSWILDTETEDKVLDALKKSF